MPHPTKYMTFRGLMHRGSLVDLLFSSGWPAT